MADSVSSSRRSEIMSHIKSKDTSIELLVRRKLFSMGYRYRVNYKALLYRIPFFQSFSLSHIPTAQ